MAGAKPTFSLEDVRENFYFYSGKASEIIRNLSLAGIAIVWILKTDTVQSIPEILLYPLIAFVLALLSDLAQYVFGAVFWNRKVIVIERDHSLDQERIEVETKKVDDYTFAFMLMKLLFMTVGYGLLIRYMILMLLPNGQC